ncbi:hypothetical protein, partial [Mycoplasma elephantis]|uniref:hypothetical protein n=1 Tax=Mycoplasma elephantis TaxID=114882 RepID=UPI00056027CF
KLKLEKGNDIDYLDFFVKGFKSLVDIKQEFDYFVKKKYSNFDADYITMHIAKDFNSPFLKKLTYEIDFNNNPTRIF